MMDQGTWKSSDAPHYQGYRDGGNFSFIYQNHHSTQKLNPTNNNNSEDNSLATPSPPEFPQFLYQKKKEDENEDELEGAVEKDSDAIVNDEKQSHSINGEEESDIKALRQTWRQFLSQWDQPLLRASVAESVPELVGIIWHREFLLLTKPVSFDRILVSPSDRNAIHVTRRLMQTLLHRTRVTAVALLLALLLAHRYRGRVNTMSLNGPAGSQYQFFLVCLVLAHKYTEDHPYSNRVWCQLGGLSLDSLNRMERELLQRLRYRIGVPPGEFQQWVAALDRRFGWTFMSLERYHEYRLLPLPPTPEAPIITRPRAAKVRGFTNEAAVVPTTSSSIPPPTSSLLLYPTPEYYSINSALDNNIPPALPIPMTATNTRNLGDYWLSSK